MKPDWKEFLLGLKWVDASYWYDMPAKSVPLVIISGNELVQRPSIPKDIAGWVVLTQSDITRGGDAFALNLVHMKYRSELLSWDDVFADFTRNPHDLRNSIEYLLREVLIDIREAYILGRTPDKTIVRAMQNLLDRVWLAIHLLLKESAYTLKQIRQAVAQINTLVWGDQELLYEMVFIEEMTELPELYKNLEALLETIDGLEI